MSKNYNIFRWQKKYLEIDFKRIHEEKAHILIVEMLLNNSMPMSLKFMDVSFETIPTGNIAEQFTIATTK